MDFLVFLLTVILGLIGTDVLLGFSKQSLIVTSISASPTPTLTARDVLGVSTVLTYAKCVNIK